MQQGPRYNDPHKDEKGLYDFILVVQSLIEERRKLTDNPTNHKPAAHPAEKEFITKMRDNKDRITEAYTVFFKEFGEYKDKILKRIAALPADNPLHNEAFVVKMNVGPNLRWLNTMDEFRTNIDAIPKNAHYTEYIRPLFETYITFVRWKDRASREAGVVDRFKKLEALDTAFKEAMQPYFFAVSGEFKSLVTLALSLYGVLTMGKNYRNIITPANVATARRFVQMGGRRVKTRKTRKATTKKKRTA